VSELQNIEHEKCTRTKPHHRCFTHADIQHPVLVQPVIWLYQSDYQNLEFIADSEALLKISDKKSLSNHAFKITAHENYVALSNHFLSIINQKRIVMLNKINRANGIYGSTPL
jgi:hypothetical protein